MSIALNAQPLEWLATTNDPGGIQVYDMTRTFADQTYIAGTFSGMTDMGGTVLQPLGQSNGHVAKYDGQGNLMWAQQMHSPKLAFPFAVEMQSNGDIVVTGLYWGELSVVGLSNNLRTQRTIKLPDPGRISVFMAAYTFYGGLLWAKGQANTPQDFIDVHGMKADRSDGSHGNIYWHGNFHGKVDLDFFQYGQYQLVSGNNGNDRSGFVAKYNNKGQIQWGASIHAPGGTSVTALAVNRGQNHYYYGKENIVIGGGFRDRLDFGANIVYNRNGYHLYFALLNHKGQRVNTAFIPAPGGGGISHIVMDPQGNIYLQGYYSNGITMGQQSYPGAGNFLAKYSYNGGFIWATVGIPYDFRIRDIALDPDNQLYLTGTYKVDTLRFEPDGENFRHWGDQDIFVAKYDAQGAFVDAFVMGGPAREYSNAVVANGNWFAIAGQHSGDIDLDPRGPGRYIRSNGSRELMLARYSYPSLVGKNGFPADKLKGTSVGGGLTVYPNPAKHTFSVAWGAAMGEKVFISLTNMQGQEVFRQGFSHDSGQHFQRSLVLDRQHLSPGIYYLRVQDARGTETQKVQLQ